VAGLAVDTSSALGESLHALVAVQDAAGDTQVWQIVADPKRQFSIPSKVGDSYSADLALNYPVARALNGVVHGAWINADGTISVLSRAQRAQAIRRRNTTGRRAHTDRHGHLSTRGHLQRQDQRRVPRDRGGNRTAMPECQTAAGAIPP